MVITLSKIYFHIDVNNAFLSWEAVKRLNEGEKTDLRTIPSAIAGDPKKRTGVILAKSPIAKKMGVKTGEPLFSALKKCPNLVCVPPNHDYYETQSNKLKKFLEKYSDEIEPYSIDECFMAHIPLLGTPLEVAEKIREDIYITFGFTVNIGISDTKYLAKIASDFEKPNKIHTLYRYEIKEKLWPLEIESMFLLGGKTAAKLRTIGIDTIGKLAKTDVNLLKLHLKSHGEELYNFAWGKDIDEKHEKKETPKSIGHSKTSVTDLTNKNEIYSFLLDITLDTANRLRKENMKAKTITVSIKTSNFKVYSSSYTLDFSTDITTELFNAAKNIFNKMYKNEPIRLLGISLSNLEPAKISQLNIFDTSNEKEHKLDKTVDDIINKFHNSHLVTRGTLIEKKNRTKNNPPY